MNKKILSKFNETYRAAGIDLLLIDMIRIFSQRYDVLSVLEGKKLKQYFVFETLENIFWDTVTMCRNDRRFQSYISSFTEFSVKTIAQLDKIISKDVLTKRDWQRAFLIFERAANYYIKVDFEFYSWSKLCQEKEKTKRNFKKLLNFKNKAREEMVNKVFMSEDCCFDRLIEKTAHQFDLNLSVIGHYMYNDVLELFDGKKVNYGVIKARQKVAVIYSFNSQVSRFWGKSARKIVNFLEEKKYSGREIKGLITYKRKEKISGQVVIVKLDFGKVKNLSLVSKRMVQGGILVADATTPEMLPIMEKAAAVVTDFGGLMSHAAIVSRELKIPCIVGTQNATTILKDGDLVEVDAERGVVKIIKRAQDDKEGSDFDSGEIKA